MSFREVSEFDLEMSEFNNVDKSEQKLIFDSRLKMLEKEEKTLEE